MRSLLASLLLLLVPEASAQDTRVTHTGCEVFLMFFRGQTPVTTIPHGNGGTLTYDRFHRSYTLVYVQDDGMSDLQHFSYVQSLPSGATRHSDESGNMWHVFDNLTAGNDIQFHPEDQGSLGLPQGQRFVLYTSCDT